MEIIETSTNHCCRSCGSVSVTSAINITIPFHQITETASKKSSKTEMASDMPNAHGDRKIN